MPSLSQMRMVGQTCSAYEAEAEEKKSDDVVRMILEHVAVP